MSRVLYRRSFQDQNEIINRVSKALGVVDQFVPWSPIEEFVVSEMRREEGDLWNEETQRWEPTAQRIADRCDLSREQVMRYRQFDRLRLRSADILCTKVLKLHPMDVYGNDWFKIDIEPWLLLPPEDRQSASRRVRKGRRDPRLAAVLREVSDRTTHRQTKVLRRVLAHVA